MQRGPLWTVDRPVGSARAGCSFNDKMDVVHAMIDAAYQ